MKAVLEMRVSEIVCTYFQLLIVTTAALSAPIRDFVSQLFDRASTNPAPEKGVPSQNQFEFNGDSFGKLNPLADHQDLHQTDRQQHDLLEPISPDQLVAREQNASSVRRRVVLPGNEPLIRSGTRSFGTY